MGNIDLHGNELKALAKRLLAGRDEGRCANGE